MSKGEAKSRQGYHHGDLRRALLVAAEAELAENGAEGFSLRGCAKRAGVSHAAPAHHFGDAAGLLSALASEGFERFLATMRMRVDAVDHGDVDKRLVASGLGYIAFARENPALFRLMFSSDRPSMGDPQLQKAAGEAFAYLGNAARHLTGDDPMSTTHGRRQVAALWAMAHGLADLTQSQRMGFLGGGRPEDIEDDLIAILAAAAMK